MSRQALVLLATVLVISPIPFAIGGAGFVWQGLAAGVLLVAVMAVVVRVRDRRDAEHRPPAAHRVR